MQWRWRIEEGAGEAKSAARESGVERSGIGTQRKAVGSARSAVGAGITTVTSRRNYTTKRGRRYAFVIFLDGS
jgi:hypothetical protein